MRGKIGKTHFHHVGHYGTNVCSDYVGVKNDYEKMGGLKT